MSAYHKKDDGAKLWLIKNIYGAWILQFRPTRDYVQCLIPNDCVDDTTVYSIKVKEIERKELFSLKTKDGKFITRHNKSKWLKYGTQWVPRQES